MRRPGGRRRPHPCAVANRLSVIRRRRCSECTAAAGVPLPAAVSVPLLPSVASPAESFPCSARPPGGRRFDSSRTFSKVFSPYNFRTLAVFRSALWRCDSSPSREMRVSTCQRRTQHLSSIPLHTSLAMGLPVNSTFFAQNSSIERLCQTCVACRVAAAEMKTHEGGARPSQNSDWPSQNNTCSIWLHEHFAVRRSTATRRRRCQGRRILWISLRDFCASKSSFRFVATQSFCLSTEFVPVAIYDGTVLAQHPFVIFPHFVAHFGHPTQLHAVLPEAPVLINQYRACYLHRSVARVCLYAAVSLCCFPYPQFFLSIFFQYVFFR